MGKNVELLHLSVSDYIASKLLTISSQFKPDVDDAFMGGSISLLKLLPPDQLSETRSRDEMMTKRASYFSALMDYTEECDRGGQFSGSRPIEEFFLHAWFPANSPGSYQRRLLSELDRVCSLTDKNWHGFYLESALVDFYGEMPVVLSWNCWKTDIFCLCLTHGIDTYVREEIEIYGYKVEERTGRRLLHFFFDVCYTQQKMPNLDILRLLLRRGAKPNEVFDGKTSWEFALFAINHLLVNRVETPKNWAELLLVLLEHGAIPSQRTDHSDLIVVCRNIRSDEWPLHGIKGLIEALVDGGAKMDQDSLKWVGDCCGQKIRTFLEKKLEERHISSSRISEMDL